jgi:hypothetical protein
MINAVLFGNMALMLQSLNKKSSTFQEKLENATDTMENLNITGGIKDQVKFYLTYTQSTLDHTNQLNSFLDMLSPSLKEKVIRTIFQDVLLTNSIFKEQEEVVQTIIQNLNTLTSFGPEDIIITQDEKGEKMYFLAKGECSVFVFDENKIKRNSAILKGGNYFGEVALLKDCRRTASVYSKTYTT